MLNTGTSLIALLVAAGIGGCTFSCGTEAAERQSQVSATVTTGEPSASGPATGQAQNGTAPVPHLRLEVVVSARRYEWSDATLALTSIEPADTFSNGDWLYSYGEISADEEQAGDTWVTRTALLLNAQGEAVGGSTSGGTFLPPTSTGIKARHSSEKLLRDLPPGRYTLREEASNADRSVVVRRDLPVHIR